MLYYPLSPVHSQIPCDRPVEDRSCISSVDAALAMWGVRCLDSGEGNHAQCAARNG